MKNRTRTIMMKPVKTLSSSINCLNYSHRARSMQRGLVLLEKSAIESEVNVEFSGKQSLHFAFGSVLLLIFGGLQFPRIKPLHKLLVRQHGRRVSSLNKKKIHCTALVGWSYEIRKQASVKTNLCWIKLWGEQLIPYRFLVCKSLSFWRAELKTLVGVKVIRTSNTLRITASFRR